MDNRCLWREKSHNALLLFWDFQSQSCIITMIFSPLKKVKTKTLDLLFNNCENLMLLYFAFYFTFSNPLIPTLCGQIKIWLGARWFTDP